MRDQRKRNWKSMWIVLFVVCLWILTGTVQAADLSYEETVAQWKSHKDVADWLKGSFSYDTGKLDRKKRLQEPQETFKRKEGVCYDAAYLVADALNRINPDYDAKAIFIKNTLGPPDHWSTAFTLEGKLYVMDYGAGRIWMKLNGIHGPFENLEDYRKFISSLDLPKFAPGLVRYTNLQNLKNK